jgi:hypothetical protein
MRSLGIQGWGGATRGLSDVVGFVLVFGLIVSAVAVVSVGGFQVLEDARDSQQATNAEQALDVLDGNVEDLAVRGAPRRSTEILLSDAELTFGDPVTFNVTAGGTNYYATNVTPLVYRTDGGAELVYVNGAVLRQHGDDAYLANEPRVSAGDRTFVPFVVTSAHSGGASATNARRVLVRTIVNGREVRTFDDPDVELNITTPRAAAWERYLEDELGEECVGPDDGFVGEVSCPLPGDEVYVQAIGVSVSV